MDNTIIQLILVKDVNQLGKCIKIDLKKSLKLEELKKILKENSDLRITPEGITILMFYEGAYKTVTSIKTFYFIVSQNHINGLPNKTMIHATETYRSIFYANEPDMEPYPMESKSIITNR
jgi:hypothetical protein